MAGARDRASEIQEIDEKYAPTTEEILRDFKGFLAGQANVNAELTQALEKWDSPYVAHSPQGDESTESYVLRLFPDYAKFKVDKTKELTRSNKLAVLKKQPKAEGYIGYALLAVNMKEDEGYIRNPNINF